MTLRGAVYDIAVLGIVAISCGAIGTADGKRKGRRLTGFLLLGLRLSFRTFLARLTMAQGHGKKEGGTLAGLRFDPDSATVCFHQPATH